MFANIYRRELQVARNLVTLRWVGIPVIFASCLAFILWLKMSFELEPIYIICCVMAVFNLYLTLHISMVSHQLSVTKGLSTLKRLMMRIISHFFANLKARGLRGLAGIPKVIAKVVSVIYLMILETLKDFPVNPLSLNNIMHTQILFDLAVVLCLTRYTGSTESPMFFLVAIPIAVAGFVLDVKAGIFYSLIACLGWFGNALLIKYGFMSHIKFYSPMFGDLHSCDSWIFSYSLVALGSLMAFATISHKLALIYKEKVSDLDIALAKTKSMAISHRHLALMKTDPWIVLDAEGKILNLRQNESSLLSSDMIGKSILDCLPDLNKANYEFTAQTVFSSRSFKKLSDVKIGFKDRSEHIYDVVVSYYKDFDNSGRLMLCFLEKTLEVNRKELVDTLRAECVHSSNILDRLTKENAELRRSLDDLSKTSSEKSAEIEELNVKVSDMGNEANSRNDRISELMSQVASVKANNDILRVELENRQMIIDDVADFMSSVGELDELVTKVERRIKDLFALENSCFHIFDSSETSIQKNEILEMRKVSPRLLDIPRNHPETLDPALREGRAVVFSAEFRPEKSAASIAITNGDLKRLVAFVPLMEEDKILGMMMLEKYSNSSNSENIVDMVSFYLKQAAGTVKNAIENRRAQNKNIELHQELVRIHNKLDSVKAMIFNDYSKDIRPFSSMLYEISKLIPLRDAVLVRLYTDGSADVCSRIDRSKSFNLNSIEEKIIGHIKANPENMVSFNAENGIDYSVAYPLRDKDRTLGVLYLYLSEELDEADKATAEFCVSMLKTEFSLYVLNEEREVWESFYSNNTVPA